MGHEQQRAPGAALLPKVLEAVLGRGRSARMTVTGASMRPMLRSGDRVTITPCTAADAHIGDLLLYRRPDGGLALHRLVRRGDGWLQTGGDACWRLDRRVPPSALLGRAVGHERAGRERRLPSAPLRRTAALLVLLRGVATARVARAFRPRTAAHA